MEIPLYDFKKVTKLRKVAGLTQQELADALNKDRTTIARFETGATNSLELLVKYAGYFGADYREYLLPAEKSEVKKFCEIV